MTDLPVQTPPRLVDWNSAFVLHLVETRASENAWFDWKESLPSDDAGRDNVRKVACAFANSGGGFLVFGVKNQMNLPPRERVVGITTVDPANQLTQLLKAVDPRVPFLDKAVTLPAGQLVWVVQVGGELAPHCHKGIFFRRYVEQSMPMTTADVRLLLINQEERVAKLRLLVLELQFAEDAADHAAGGGTLRKINTDVLARLAADVWPQLQSTAGLPQRLIEARTWCENLNFELDCFIAHPKGQASKNPRIQSMGQSSRRIIQETLALLSKHLNDPSIAPKQIG